MLDLDDLSQVAIADRSGLLRRAAGVQDRWQLAVENGRQVAGHIELPGTDLLWLHVPPTLRGIGQAVQNLWAFYQTEAASPKVLLWHEAYAGLPVTGCRLALDVESGLPGERMELSPWLDADDHPASSFLFLISLLDAWHKGKLSSQVTALSPDLLESLQRCAVDVPSDRNPAKGLAHTLSDRLPIFWAQPSLAGIAQDWCSRYLLYAESKAEWSTADDIRRIQVMARFPRYWPQAGSFVRLAESDVDSSGWLEGWETLCQRRRLHSLTIAPPAPATLGQTIVYLLELGEWVALYSAALLGVDPSERTALDFLSVFDE